MLISQSQRHVLRLTDLSQILREFFSGIRINLGEVVAIFLKVEFFYHPSVPLHTKSQ